MAIRVADHYNRAPVTAAPDENLRQAAQRMRREHVGCVLVVDAAQHPIGILTDRDIVVRVLAQTDRFLEQVRIDDVMTQPVLSIEPEAELHDALRVMRRKGVRRLAVVEPQGTLAGVLSLDDVIEGLQASSGELADLLRGELRNEAQGLSKSAAG